MNNIVLSTRNIDDFISDVANEVIRKMELLKSNPKLPEPDRWFDLNQLVEYDPEQRTKATFYGYIHRREIPFHKRGKKLTFLQSEINDWLKQGRQQTVAEIAENTHLYLKPKKGGNNG